MSYPQVTHKVRTSVAEVQKSNVTLYESNVTSVHFFLTRTVCINAMLYFVYDPAEQLVQVGLPSTAANWPRGHSGQ